MKLTECFTVACCEWEFTSDSRYKAVAALLDHIQKNHPPLMEKLKRKGRELARSQNGLGYFDSRFVNGWDEASLSFRQAWITSALEERLMP